jgi:hypothetical protein
MNYVLYEYYYYSMKGEDKQNYRSYGVVDS